MEMKYRKFIDNGNGDCIYCHERRHDCCCDEKTAKSLGYHYENMSVTEKVERPPMPEGLTEIERLTFFIAHPTSKKISFGVWRKGKTWFRSGADLVDYHNSMQS